VKIRRLLVSEESLKINEKNKKEINESKTYIPRARKRSAGLEEVSGDAGGAAETSVHVENTSDDADVLQVRFHPLHGVHRLQHRPEAPDPRLLRLLQRHHRRPESVRHFHRLRASTHKSIADS